MSYEAPALRKYEDHLAADEGELRWKFEFSRQKLYARGPKQTFAARPQSGAQEAYQPEAGPLRGANVLGEPVQLPASCATCQGCLTCRSPEATDVFCVNCNRAALTPETSIASLFK